VRSARRKPSSSTTRTLGAKYDLNKGTVATILKDKKFNYKTIRKETKLSQTQMNDRVNYCKTMLKRKGAPIDETFFSDEMGLNLSDSMVKKAWMGPRKQIKVEKPFKDVRVNCWGGISRNGATSLEIYKGTLNADRYKVIVNNHKEEMAQAYPRKVKFQHDNLRVHTSSEASLGNSNFEIIKFPKYSPDLNPIENLWGALKDYVRRDAPKTENQLVKSLNSNWEILTEVSNLQPYFDNLHTRYEECIKKKGIRLQY
jgi:hypothetical protein